MSIYNNMDNYCRDCTNRSVGCHNVDTCEKWREHEENKTLRYEQKEKEIKKKQVERTLDSLKYRKRKR